jgi:pyridoxamine 5'-phosphate oxidase
MNFQEYVDFAKGAYHCFMATIDGDQPRVRPIGTWFADKTGFYFQTESVKLLPKQLQKNNKVELCYFGKDGKVMRVTGKTKFITDKSLRAKVMEDRPYLKDFVKDPDDLVLFQVYTGEAYFWTMANNMKEAAIERVKF